VDERDSWKPWLAGDLEEWSEPSLFRHDPGLPTESIRYLPHWGGLASPIRLIRVEHTGNGTTLTFKWIVHEVIRGPAPQRPESEMVSVGPHASAVFHEESRVLTHSETAPESLWTALIACLDKHQFWEARSPPPRPMFDGDHSVLEATVGERYNVLYHDAFSGSSLPDGLAFVDLLKDHQRDAERRVGPEVQRLVRRVRQHNLQIR
jgi:hypothetical protein